MVTELVMNVPPQLTETWEQPVFRQWDSMKTPPAAVIAIMSSLTTAISLPGWYRPASERDWELWHFQGSRSSRAAPGLSAEKSGAPGPPCRSPPGCLTCCLCCSSTTVPWRSAGTSRAVRPQSGRSRTFTLTPTAGGTLATGQITTSLSRAAAGYLVFSFLIGGDGLIYEGRGWNVQGAHTGGFNTVGYGVCFLGDFTAHNPSQPARAAYTSLVNCALEMGKIAVDFQMFGHRQTKPVGGTECPGDTLYSTIQSWPHWVGHSVSQCFVSTILYSDWGEHQPRLERSCHTNIVLLLTLHCIMSDIVSHYKIPHPQLFQLISLIAY